MAKKTYYITPTPKPRQTRSDKWQKRPRVMRYRAFALEVKAAGIFIPDSGSEITFIMPMPKSWSKKKRTQMIGKPHQQRPDIDNLLKALLDAIYEDDSCVWNIKGLSKYWGEKGAICII